MVLTAQSAAKEKTTSAPGCATQTVTRAYDALGNATGYAYDPMGRVAAVIAQRGAFAAANPWRFSSEFADDELGCDYYNYREYEPVSGRWLGKDKIGVRGGDNEYCCLFNNTLSRCDSLGSLSTGDKISIKTGGFWGLFANECGTITIDDFSTYFGVNVRYYLTKDERYNEDLYGVNIEMSFNTGKDFYCCCKSGQYRWQQKIIRDDFNPKDVGKFDGPPACLPYYNDGGNSLWDVPGQTSDGLSHLKKGMSGTVMFSTCIVCHSDSEGDNVLGCISWGFEIRRTGFGYRIERKP